MLFTDSVVFQVHHRSSLNSVGRLTMPVSLVVRLERSVFFYPPDFVIIKVWDFVIARLDNYSEMIYNLIVEVRM